MLCGSLAAALSVLGTLDAEEELCSPNERPATEQEVERLFLFLPEQEEIVVIVRAAH